MSPHQKYKSNIMSIATKEQKMVMIFNEIIKVLNKAIICIDDKDFEGKNTHLRTAADAFDTLRTGIDIENGGEFAKYLDAFCHSVSGKIEFSNMGSVKPSELNSIVNGIMQVRDLFKDE